MRMLIAIALTAITAVGFLAAGNAYVNSSLAGVERVPVSGLNSQGNGPIPGGKQSGGPTKVENYLLVGSDSREGADPTDPDYGGIGSTAKTGGMNSDTIMVLRFDPATGTSALLSLPRDLYVTIPADTPFKDRINQAFGISRDMLIKTIQTSLGIPIHHYVEINFASFKALVDAIGGVSIYLTTPVRDINTGLEILNPGCVKLGGVQAREWVRARHLEYKRTGKWVSDESSDFGRISRQQDFIRRALKQAISKATNPLVASQLVQVATDNLKVDPNLDLIGLANRLRQLGSGTIDTYTLPNTPTVVQMPKLGKQDVLNINEAAARPILDYFAGASADAPAAATTESPTSLPAPAGGKGAAGVAPIVVPAIVAQAATPPSTTPPVGVLPDAARQCEG